MGSPRIKGTKLTFTVGDTDYAPDGIKVAQKSEAADRDVTTFEDAAQPGGARQWFLEVECISSLAKLSFWRYLWDNAGQTVAYIWAPQGNTAPSEDQPHFTGQVTLPSRPDLEVEAAKTSTFTVRMDLPEGTSPALLKA